MPASRSRSSTFLTVALVVASFVAAVSGLFWPDLYRDPASGSGLFSRAYWHGNDLVTLVVALPVAIGALLRTRRGSARARVVWLAMVYFLLYNFSFYLFGATMSRLYPLHLGIVLVAGLLLAVTAYGDQVPRAASTGGGWRLVAAGYLGLLALIVVVLWTTQCLGSLDEGTSGTDKGEFIRTVAALDTVLLAMPHAVCCRWLVLRRPVARAAGAALSLSTATYMLVLVAQAVTNARAGVGEASGEIGQWAVLAIGSLCVGLGLLRSRFAAPAAEGRWGPAALDMAGHPELDTAGHPELDIAGHPAPGAYVVTGNS